MRNNSTISLICLGKQKTIKNSISIIGPTPFIAGHSTEIKIKPAKKGISFTYFQEKSKHTIKVNSKNTISANGENTTLIAKNDSEVKTVEHILSALTGLGINACEIELIGSNQVPTPDSSAEIFTQKIMGVGDKTTSEDNLIAKVNSDIFFTDNQGSLAILRPSDKLTISVLIQFPEPIGEQYIRFIINPKTYVKEISWARSYIRRNCDNRIWNLCRKQIPALPKNIYASPVLVFNENRWIIKPKRPDEPVRHKLLDAIGDLTTLGYPIIADITLIRPGHEFNRKLVNYLYSLIKG